MFVIDTTVHIDSLAGNKRGGVAPQLWPVILGAQHPQLWPVILGGHGTPNFGQ